MNDSSPTRSDDRPRRVLLMCAETLRAHACCVEDALRTRGWSTRLEIGRRARRWVRRAPPGPSVLRILLVPEQLDPSVLRKLRRGSDPTGRGGLHVVCCDTPRGVVHEIERLGGYPSYVRRNPSPSRMVLAHPTLCEQALYRDRRWFAGAAAAVAAFSAGWVTMSAVQSQDPAPVVSRHAPPLSTPAQPAPAREIPSYVDEPMFAAAAVDADLELDDEALAFDEDFEVSIEDNVETIDWDPEVRDDEILIWDESVTPTIAARPTETFDATAPIASLGAHHRLDETIDLDVPTEPGMADDGPIPEEAAPLEIDPDAFAPMLPPVTLDAPSGVPSPIASGPRPFVPVQLVLPNAPKPTYTIDPFESDLGL